MPSIMNHGDVDIRVLALRRQQNRKTTATSNSSTPIEDITYSSRIQSGRSTLGSAYETTPIKTYSLPSSTPRTITSTPVRKNSYFTSLPSSLFDEDTRIGRMHIPPVVRCQCNEVESYALISTSETVSSMSTEFVKKLKLSDQIIPENNQVFNPLVMHQPDIKGKVKYIDLCIGSWQQVAQFNIVDNYVSDLTLGIDFLRRTQSTVNFEDSCLLLGGQNGERIPFLTSREVMGLAKRNSSKHTFIGSNGFSESE